MTEPKVAENGKTQGGDGGAAAGPIRRFGVFEMNLGSGELRKSGVVVHLQPQPFTLLAMLTARPGEVVTRREMRQELWGEGPPVDFEQSLSFCVRQVRLALDDSAQTPRFVETLPRQGYRWVGGPIETVQGDAARGERGKLPPSHPEVEVEKRRPPAWPPTSRSPGWGWRWGVALVGLVVLVFVGLSVLRRTAPSTAAHFQRVTFRRGFLTAARFGPGGQVVYAASWDGQPLGVYESRLDSRGARSLGFGAFRISGVSPSGDVAFIRDGILARAPLAGGPPRMVARDVRAADWTANGSAFALARTLKEGYQIEYPVGRPLLRIPSVTALRVSPNGRHLAFSQHPTLADDRGFVVIVDRTGTALAKSATFGSLEGLAWSPKGDEVWFTAAGVGVKNSLRTLGLDGRERILLESIGRLVLHDVAADGRLLISRSTLRAEILFQRAGEPDAVDLSWLDVSAVAALSSDGDTILFYEGGEGGGPDYTTFMRRTDGSTPVRLGDGRAVDLSPDGRWVLVIPVTRPDRILLLPTGAGETRQIRGPDGMVAHDAAGWLPDGAPGSSTRRAAGLGGFRSPRASTSPATPSPPTAANSSPGAPLPTGTPVSTRWPAGARVASRAPRRGGRPSAGTSGAGYSSATVPGWERRSASGESTPSPGAAR